MINSNSVHQHSCLLSGDSPSIKQKGPKSNSLNGWLKQNDTNRNYASLIRIGSHARGSTNEKVDPCPSVLFWAQILPPWDSIICFETYRPKPI